MPLIQSPSTANRDKNFPVDSCSDRRSRQRLVSCQILDVTRHLSHLWFVFFRAVYSGISTPKEFTSLLMVTIVVDVLALEYLSVESHVSHHHPHAVTEPVKHKWPF